MYYYFPSNQTKIIKVKVDSLAFPRTDFEPWTLSDVNVKCMTKPQHFNCPFSSLLKLVCHLSNSALSTEQVYSTVLQRLKMPALQKLVFLKHVLKRWFISTNVFIVPLWLRINTYLLIQIVCDCGNCYTQFWICYNLIDLKPE